MECSKVVKCFTFREKHRDSVELGTGTRMNPRTNRIQLLRDPTTLKYSTDDDLYVRTWVSNPQAVKKWLGFDVVASHPTDCNGDPITSVAFKLSDGTSDYYWDGYAWAPAGSSDWSTEAEVADNIETFPISSKKLQIVINLKTTDGDYTPELALIRVLYEVCIDFQSDLIYGSLIPALAEKVNPVAAHVFIVSNSSSVVNINQVKLETPYKIKGVHSVFNHSVDTTHDNDIFVTYDESSQNLILSQSIAAGQAVWINFLYEPMIAVTTSQDFNEVERIPAILFSSIDLVDANERQIDDFVRNKGQGTAWIVPAPIQGDLQITLQMLTDKAADNRRLATEVQRFFGKNPILRSTGLDEEYRLWLIDEYGDRTTTGQKEVHTSEATFRIVGVRIWNKDAYEGYLVTNPPSLDMRINPL